MVIALACGHATAQNFDSVAVSFYNVFEPSTGPLPSGAIAGPNANAGNLNWDISQDNWNNLPGDGSSGGDFMLNLTNSFGMPTGMDVEWDGTGTANIDWPGSTPDGMMMQGALFHWLGEEIWVEFTNIPSHYIGQSYHIFVYVDWEWDLASQNVALMHGGNVIESYDVEDVIIGDPNGFQNPQYYIDATPPPHQGNYVAFYFQQLPEFTIVADAGGQGISYINGIQIVAHPPSAPCQVCGIPYPNATPEGEPCGSHINDPCGGPGCFTHCGGMNPAGCWCDSQCCGFGDCCFDQQAVCNQCTWPGPQRLSCPDQICGTLWMSEDGTMDEDRYAIEVPDTFGSGVAHMDVTMHTETPVRVWVDNGMCPHDPGYVSYGMMDLTTCQSSSMTVPVPAPDVHYIFIEPLAFPGFCPNESTYVLEVDVDTCTTGPGGPPNELCANAMSIGLGSTSFNNIGAVTDGPPSTAPCAFTGVDDSDVWFEFVPNHSQTHMVTVHPTGGQPDRMFEAYHGGCPIAGQAPLDCNQSLGGAATCMNFAVSAGDLVTLRVGTPGGPAGQGDSIIEINPCPADLNGDGVVDVFDLIELINNWGPCPLTGPCVGDLNCDGVVDVFDLIELINQWGPCP